MKRRKRGLGSTGSTVPRTARISLQADARIRALADHIESDDGKPISACHVLSLAAVIGLGRLEEQHGMHGVEDCGEAGDSCPAPVDTTRSQLADNCAGDSDEG